MGGVWRSGLDVPALFCGSRRLSCVDPRWAMVVIGSFGFVENGGTSFEGVGLKELKDRKATEQRKSCVGNRALG